MLSNPNPRITLRHQLPPPLPSPPFSASLSFYSLYSLAGPLPLPSLLCISLPLLSGW